MIPSLTVLYSKKLLSVLVVNLLQEKVQEERVEIVLVIILFARIVLTVKQDDALRRSTY